jgi:hypothetical protein
VSTQQLSQPHTSLVRCSRSDQLILLGFETVDQMHQHRHGLARPHCPAGCGALYLHRHQGAPSGIGQIEID